MFQSWDFLKRPKPSSQTPKPQIMQRIGFLIRVKPEKIEEYKRIHQNVWPELLAELKNAGFSNYSLFLSPSGLEFGTLECENWEATCEILAKSQVHTRWQNFMRDFLATPVGDSSQPVEMLESVFFLA